MNRSAAAYVGADRGPGDGRDRTGADGDDGQLGRRVGVREAPARGAAGADGGVPDPPGGLGEQRVVGLRGERAVPDEGADPQAAAGPRADRGEVGYPVDVDEHARAGHPQRQHRHEALAAREDLAVAVGVPAASADGSSTLPART